jgi:hypothetical protein
MAKKREKQSWDVGDIFLVPTSDGLYAVGQVLGHERAAMDSATCALFDFRVKRDEELKSLSVLPPQNLLSTLLGRMRPRAGPAPMLLSEKLFAVLFATRESLDDGSWRVVKRLPV